MLLAAMVGHRLAFPLSASSWDIQYSQNIPAHPSTAGAGWAFDFPKGTNCSNKDKCPGVHYVTTKYTKVIPYMSTLTISGEITVTDNPTFNYQLESTDTCLSPPNARGASNPESSAPEASGMKGKNPTLGEGRRRARTQQDCSLKYAKGTANGSPSGAQMERDISATGSTIIRVCALRVPCA
jgi:hypothetical protein